MSNEIQEEFNFEDEVKPTKKAYDNDPEETRSYNKNVDVTIEEKISSKDASERWKNRRRMAWISLLCLIAMTLLLFFVVDSSKLDKLENVAVWIAMSFTSIVGFYMGATAYVDVRGFKK